jgi:transcriptional regulator with XRE-family HTH domain
MNRQSSPAADLGRTIRAERRRAGLTQAELARRAGIASNHLSRLESGEKIDPRFATIAKLALALNVSLDRLAQVRGSNSSIQRSDSGGAERMREVVRAARLALSIADLEMKRALKKLGGGTKTK